MISFFSSTLGKIKDQKQQEHQLLKENIRKRKENIACL